VIPLGHRTYLKAKAGGENSRSGKAGSRETINRLARRDPDDPVHAKQHEAKYPHCKYPNLETMVDIQGSQKPGQRTGPEQERG
jgi:hypothetical protein